MRSLGFPLAAPTGNEPRDSADVLREQERATRRDRIRLRVTAVVSGLLALLYAGSYIAPLVAPEVKQWQGLDFYVKKELPPR